MQPGGPVRFLAPKDGSKIPAQVNEPPPLQPLPPQMYSMYPKVWKSVWPEGAGSDPSWGQDVNPHTYLSQMGPFLHPPPPALPERSIIFEDLACDIDL